MYRGSSIVQTRPRDHGDPLRPEMDLLGRTRAFYVGTLSGHVPGRVCLSRKWWLIIRSPGISRTQVPVYPREANILPPTPGATCPNKTNKSGGPKDVADARPAPLPPHTKMLSLSDWKEWMGTMSALTGTRDTMGESHLILNQELTVSQTINQNKLISKFKANPQSKPAIRQLGLTNGI